MDLITELTPQLLDAILAGLDSKREFFESLAKGKGDVRGINGISFDLYPWHDYFALSLRDDQQLHESSRYNPAEWVYFEFFSTKDSTNATISKVAKLLTREYRNPRNGVELREFAHLMFIAAAEALLNPRVANALYTFGVKNAPVVGDQPIHHSFEYMILDSDGTFNLNYCELVLANRVTRRLQSSLG